MSAVSENLGSVSTAYAPVFKTSLQKKRDSSVRFKKVMGKNPIIGDNRPLYVSMLARHFDDAKYIKSIENFDIEDRTLEPSRLSFPERDPSYTNFKVPYPMICQERYDKSIRKYNNQLNWEIRNLIDNQLTATEATYFVRSVSYTSLWPPYHTEAEIDETSRSFYSLQPKEKSRLKVIMETDCSYI